MQKFKMKHLIKVLISLQLANIQELFQYLDSTLTYELKEFQTLDANLQTEFLKSKEYEPTDMVNILVKTDEVKIFDFVIACICATQKISQDEASDLIENTSDLLKKCLEFQKEIIEFQSLVKNETSPNEKATS